MASASAVSNVALWYALASLMLYPYRASTSRDSITLYTWFSCARLGGYVLDVLHLLRHSVLARLPVVLARLLEAKIQVQ